METVSETQDDSSGANPSSVKSEDGSPTPDGDRSSPPPNCAICLGRCRNKSFTDSCLHQFCFKCLVTWSKVKTECPLCKQNFKSIIHNVQSNQQYEEYQVEQRRQEEERIDIDDIVTATRRFRYRTTLTFPRGGEHIALHRLLMRYPPLSAVVGMSRDMPAITPAALPSSRRRRSPGSFRRTVYRHNLWARPLPDFTGRHRDCTPEFYRYNDSQMHRLVPWLNRELHYLLLENTGHIAYVLQRILELLPQYHITSPEFREEMYRYLGSRTDHFLHELHCYASTPYDLTGYDHSVQYTTEDMRAYVNTVNDLSSSDSDSADSDVVEVLDASVNRQRSVEVVDTTINSQRSTPPSFQPCFRPVTPILTSPYTEPGPANRRAVDPVYPLNLITSPTGVNRLAQNNVIPIETISNSDTDDDEVMVTGYIKPPHQRTPEVVDLRDSDNDSDVVVTEAPVPAPQPRFPVKLTLSRPRPAESSSDSDDESYTPPEPPSRSRQRSSSNESVRSSQSSEGDSSSYNSSSTTSGEETPKRQKKDTARRKRSSNIRSSRRKQRPSTENQKYAISTSTPFGSPSATTSSATTSAPIPSTSASTSEPSTSAMAGSSRSSSDRRRRDLHTLIKSASGKGVKISRKVESTTLESENIDQPLVESRDSAKSDSSSKDDDAPVLRDNFRKEVRDEPQPGPSSQPDDVPQFSRELLNSSDSTTPGKDGKMSRKGKHSRINKDEARPAHKSKRDSHHSRIKKERKHRRHNEGSTKTKDEPQPGPSTQPNDSMKSWRRDNPSESKRDPRSSTDETKPESTSSSKSTTSRGGESSSSSSNCSSQGKSRQDENSATRYIDANEVQPETSRHSGKERSNDKESESSREQSHHRDRSSESRNSADAREGSSQGYHSSQKRKNSDELSFRHENKRLKSVVKKASRSSSSSPTLSSIVHVPSTSKKLPLSSDSFSDSDDDIPLNLTIHRSGGHS